jgi:hypothetical protein
VADAASSFVCLTWISLPALPALPIQPQRIPVETDLFLVELLAVEINPGSSLFCIFISAGALQKFFFLFFLLPATALLPARAQHEGFLYGEVTLVSNERYTGQIYWSAGQRLWVDMLTVEKQDNPVLQYLNQDQLENLSEVEAQKQLDWEFMDLWKNNYPSRKHTLRCRFGDIAAIAVTGRKQAVIILKNEKEIKVSINEDPEYRNQLGRKIMVQHQDKLKVTLAWEQIAHIRFMPSPARLAHLHALPLYGTVATRSGLSYTGLIRWDQDEYLTANWVDGRGRDNKPLKVRFEDVKSIRPKEEGALVSLVAGKELYLQGNSNVNRKNQGIVVRHPAWGQVTIRWKDFKAATFSAYPAASGFGYAGFQKPKTLQGSVRTRDHKNWKGTLVYDLDEQMDIETLDGWDAAGALRQVPFRYIREVAPKNSRQATVTLKNGHTLVLGERSDVSEKNWGMMIWPQPGKFKYIPWNNVSRIILE